MLKKIHDKKNNQAKKAKSKKIVKPKIISFFLHQNIILNLIILFLKLV